METLFNDLQKHLAENFGERISLIDEDYGQLEALQSGEDQYPVTFPCILIGMPQVDWRNLKPDLQQGTLSLTVRLAFDCYDDTHYGSTTTERISERSALRAKVHKLLQGYRVDDVTELIRTNSRFYTWDHGIKVYEQTYTGVVTEIIEPETEPVKATPMVTIGTTLK